MKTRKTAVFLILYILLLFPVAIVYAQQESDIVINYENDFETFSLYRSAMGGVSITNIFNPYSFLINPSLTHLMDLPGNFYVSGAQLYIPATNRDKFYPFYNYNNLVSLSDDESYLRSFQSLNSQYGYSGVLQFMVISKYFSIGVFTNSTFSMSYEDKGLPPALNFRIDEDFMATFSLSFPLEYDIGGHYYLLSFGGRLQYIQRNTYMTKLNGDKAFLVLDDYVNSSVSEDTFKSITNGYSKQNALALHLGITLRFDFLVFGASYNNVSLPYEGILGTQFSRKVYNAKGEELPATDAVYVIPSTLNTSFALYFEDIAYLDIFKDFYIGVDVLDLFSEEFSLENIKLGINANLLGIINVMAGADINSLSAGVSINVIFLDVGISYNTNLHKENKETDYVSFMLLFYF
ncbi:MAG: hypothetical protein ACOCV8_06160 [Spirochaetota bacterium]